MDEDSHGTSRRWLGVLFLCVLLHLGAFWNSDLGLDAHVRLNAINNAGDDGQTLDWGKLRLTADTVQSPNNSATYDGYIPPWSTTETAMKLTSLFALFMVAGLAGIVPRWQRSSERVDPRWSALILMSPVFLFATGRGYDEAMIALLIGVGVSGYYVNKGDEIHQIRIHVLLLATSLLLVMGWKGFGLLTSLGVWLGAAALGAAWMELERHQRGKEGWTWLAHPWYMGGSVAITLYLLLFVAGFLTDNGTFSIIGEQPFHYLIATVFALIDGLGIYLLIGFAFWPFLSPSLSRLIGLRGPGITLLVMFSSGLLTALVAYMAALWTLESTIWNLSLPETMFLLGNNGRYATCLVIPIVLILNWERPFPSEEQPARTSLLAAFCLLIPAILFTSLVGQQLWSEDAGEELNALVTDQDTSIMLVAPETLSMHHLYVMKTHIDLDGSSGIDGYWRTVEDAANLLAEDAWVPNLVVVAPHVQLDLDQDSWRLVGEQNTPATVTGGLGDGAWRIYRHVG